MKIKEIVCFPNGNTMVFDDKEEQVETLQTSWLLLYVDFLVKQGVKPDGLDIKMPNGKIATIFKLPSGKYNWLFNL